MTPRIIRTVDELDDLDPDTLLRTVERMDSAFFVLPVDLPAVVLATGEHVRAARKALEDAS